MEWTLEYTDTSKSFCNKVTQMFLNDFRFGLMIVFVANPATVGEAGFLYKLKSKLAVASNLSIILTDLH